MKRFLLWLWKVLPMTPRMRFVAMWLMNQKFLLGVAGVVVDADGRVLLLDHSYRPTEPWGLPSGWVKGQGEQPQEALVREIREECGLEVAVLSVLHVRIDPVVPRIDLTMLCRPVGRTDGLAPRDAEIAAAGFFKPDEFPEGLQQVHRDLIRLAGVV